MYRGIEIRMTGNCLSEVMQPRKQWTDIIQIRGGRWRVGGKALNLEFYSQQKHLSKTKMRSQVSSSSHNFWLQNYFSPFKVEEMSLERQLVNSPQIDL